MTDALAAPSHEFNSRTPRITRDVRGRRIQASMVIEGRIYFGEGHSHATALRSLVQVLAESLSEALQDLSSDD